MTSGPTNVTAADLGRDTLLALHMLARHISLALLVDDELERSAVLGEANAIAAGLLTADEHDEAAISSENLSVTALLSALAALGGLSGSDAQEASRGHLFDGIAFFGHVPGDAVDGAERLLVPLEFDDPSPGYADVRFWVLTAQLELIEVVVEYWPGQPLIHTNTLTSPVTAPVG